MEIQISLNVVWFLMLNKLVIYWCVFHTIISMISENGLKKSKISNELSSTIENALLILGQREMVPNCPELIGRQQ